MLAAAGAQVDGDRVRFDPDLVTSLISTTPSEFTLHAPDPSRHLHIGGDSVAFTDVASAPNFKDRAGGRRPGAHADFRTMVKLEAAIQST